MIDWQNVIWIVIGAVLYAIGYKITEIIIDEIKEKKIRVRKKKRLTSLEHGMLYGRQQLKEKKISITKYFK